MSLYAKAWSLYEADRYQEAEKIFRELTVKEGIRPSYWKGLGHTLKMQKKFAEALDAYCAALYLGAKTETSFLVHVAECYKEVGDKSKLNSLLQLIEQKAEPTNKTWIIELKKAWCNS